MSTLIRVPTGREKNFCKAHIRNCIYMNIINKSPLPVSDSKFKQRAKITVYSLDSYFTLSTTLFPTMTASSEEQFRY